MYSAISNFLKKFLSQRLIFKYGFNLSPMYRRSTGRVYFVSEDLMEVKIKIPLSYKNSNYVGTIFGGSMTSATDPIYMIQLINILGEKYVIWDKSMSIRFKRPAKETAYANFNFSKKEIAQIKTDVETKNEIDLVKNLNLTNKDGTTVYAELVKTIYIADKAYYKLKRSKSKSST